MTGRRFGHILLVGGTGMLAGACRVLAGRADRLTLAARHPESLADDLGVAPLRLDWHGHAAAIRAIAGLAEPDLLVSWLHDDAIWLVQHLERLLPPGGRSIRIHGAASRDPARLARRDPQPRPGIARQTVILGWVNKADRRRWLHHDEICQGVIRAVDTPAHPLIVVGTVDE